MFSLFGLTFSIYGMIIGIAAMVGLWICDQVIEKSQVDVKTTPIYLSTLFFGIIGARVYHLATDWQLYQSAGLIEMIAIWNGGLGIYGGLLGGILGILFALWWQKKLSLMVFILDVGALALPFGQAIGRWGNYFNQELFGTPTRLFWGIGIDLAHRPLEFRQPLDLKFHPLFLYESILMLLLGYFLWRRYQVSPKEVGTGKILAMYLIGYSTIRFLLEFLRINSARSLLFPQLTIAQWVSVSMIVGSIVFILLTHFKYRLISRSKS